MNRLGAAMNLLSFGYQQIRRVTFVSNFNHLEMLSKMVANNEPPNIEIASKFSVDQLINSIRITICFENFMKGLLLLDDCIIHKLRKKVYGNFATLQYTQPILINDAFKGQKWEVNPEIELDNEDLKKQLPGILRTTIGMQELLKPKYQEQFKIDESIINICRPYFEYRNNLHLYMAEQFSISPNSAENFRQIVDFINNNLVRIHNLIIKKLNKGDQYNLNKIKL